MRGVRIAFIAVLGLPLAGCLGVTIPPKELPEWAMQPRAADIAPGRQRVVRKRTSRTVAQRGLPDQTAPVSYVEPAPVSSAAKHSGPDETKPFSPEWAARENALDARLRRRMHICGGC